MNRTTITIEPLTTAARDLPLGMVFTVCDVLEAYGLKVKDESLNGRGMVEVRQALFGVINAVPDELGGRQQSSQVPDLGGAVIELPDPTQGVETTRAATAEERLARVQGIVEAGYSDAYTAHLIRQVFPRREPNPIKHGS